MREPHPAFPQPSDLEATVWRYMDYWKFQWLVENGRLLMPQADLLDDPLEGTQPKGDLEWWKRQEESAVSEKTRRIVHANERTISQFSDYFRNKYYVSCWHMNRDENADMWKYYTNGPESVAIWTSYIRLCECLPDYAYVGLVSYIDYEHDSVLSSSLNLMRYIMHKDQRFAFENEVRAVVTRALATGAEREALERNLFSSESNEDFVVFAPRIDIAKLIQGTVLHPNSPERFVAQLAEICEARSIEPPRRSKYAS